jgi:ribonuclease E
MTKRMLIDASHTEEIRVVVLDGNRLEEFDVEAENKKPLKSNIYLAKVVRVEPSLQAAFVEYGGNRHGFLAFSEIHPDYYQLPQADRQRLLEMQAAEAAEDDDEDEGDGVSEAEADAMVAAIESIADADEAERAAASEGAEANASVFTESAEPEGVNPRHIAPENVHPVEALRPEGESPEAANFEGEGPEGEKPEGQDQDGSIRAQPMTMRRDSRSASTEDLSAIAEPPMSRDADAESEEDETPPETLGGRGKDESDEGSSERRMPSRFMRHYKIQEVIRRRQIMLVQVVKEERGNKGAALTTYISLAGRFSVLMPNSPRGGGISRKITSAGDRKRLREAVNEVGLPKGMSLIVRTAGASRPKPEITRDCEYLLHLWDEIRTRTLESMAPALVYEEADLVKRSIRDVFGTGIDEIQIEGEDAFRQARDFMRMLMPQNERKIRLYKDPTSSLFSRNGVDAQLDAMMSPIVQLKSGGYIVINQTEALVAIDVNSGRATRDRHIEDTALRTNCEAAEEVARQLRLRDLAGLIVIDFIDMEVNRNIAQVERRMKEALKNDRARIQVGRISHFGLMEMSRQRLRPSVTEHSFETCVHCQGLGIVRSAESGALHVMRAIEEEGAKRRASEIMVHVAPALALHLLNRKRDRLVQIEARYGMTVLFEPDATLLAPAVRIERIKAQLVAEAVTAPSALRMDYAPDPVVVAEAEVEPVREVPRAEPVVAQEATPQEVVPSEAAPVAVTSDEQAEGEGKRRRRRRRRRGGRREDGSPMTPQEAAAEAAEAEGEQGDEGETGDEAPVAETGPAEATVTPAEAVAPAPRDERGEDGRLRRRGRRGGGRPRREDEPVATERPAQSQPRPRYTGPTPADPFAGGSLEDIFDAMAAAEEAAMRGSGAMAPEPVVEAPVAATPVAETPVAAEPIAAEPVIAEQAVAEPALPVTETAEAPAKAKGRRVAKPKAAAAPKPAAEPKPEKAPRAPRGRKAAAAAVEAAVAEAPVVAEMPVVETPVVVETAPDAAPAKPGRRRAPSKRAVADVAAATVPAAVEAASGAPAMASSAMSEPVVSQPAGSAPSAAAPVQPVLVETTDDAAPKKRGWWRR